jgi:hypothetical protein
MNKEQWETFADQVTHNLNINKTPTSTQTSESLETTWHKIQTSIINAATKCIPNKKFTIRNFQHSFSAKSTLLHQSLKKLNSIIRQVKSSLANTTPIPIHLNSSILYLNSTHHLNIDSIPNLYELIPNWITNTNTEWQALYHARNIENIKQIRDQINQHITNRCFKLQTNPKAMINSILNRHKDPVKINNIKTPNDIITDPKLIKEQIKQHFDNWTAYRPIDTYEFNSNWLEEYQPKTTTKSDYYNSALAEFSIDEILTTLNQLPNNKACSPSGISYEMLKQAGPVFL